MVPILRLDHLSSFIFSGNTLINMLEYVSLVILDCQVDNQDQLPQSMYLINKDNVILYSPIVPYATIDIRKLTLILCSHLIGSHLFPRFHKDFFHSRRVQSRIPQCFWLPQYHSMLVDPPYFLDFHDLNSFEDHKKVFNLVLLIILIFVWCSSMLRVMSLHFQQYFRNTIMCNSLHLYMNTWFVPFQRGYMNTWWGHFCWIAPVNRYFVLFQLRST